MLRQFAFRFNIFNWFCFQFQILFGEDTDDYGPDEQNRAENHENENRNDHPETVQAIEEGWDEIDFDNLIPVLVL